MKSCRTEAILFFKSKYYANVARNGNNLKNLKASVE